MSLKIVEDKVGIVRLAMKHESCPELYTCQRVKMTPMIRVLLHCSAAQAMDSICAECDVNNVERGNDLVYKSSSGQTIAIVVGEEEGEQSDKVLASNQAGD